MRKLKKIILVSVSIVFLLLIINSFVFAQRQLEVDYPTIEGARPQDISFTLPEYVKYIFNFSLAIAGLIAFAVLIYGGFGYLTSAGSPVKQKDARGRIFAAILGLIVLICSYLILTTINPELVFLSIPERVAFDKDPLIEIEPKEKESLAYTEIPLGGVLAELLSDARLANIKIVVEETKEKAEEVKNLSQELKALTEACDCLNCDHGYCEPGSCGGENCGCVSYCKCEGAPGGEYDPCPNRETINNKREELKTALSETETDKGLRYWQKGLDIEINGSSEEGIIGFREVYEDFKSAENTIKSCPLSLNKKGHSQILLGYKEFWQYRQALEENEEIKGGDPEYPFDYISSDNPYYLANFYCTEILYSVPEMSIDIEETGQIEIPATVEKESLFCGSEIAIGETTDNAEELARRILVELDNINDNILSGIETVETLSDLPEECNCNNCISSMETSEVCCEWYCCGCCPPPALEPEEGENGDDGDNGDGGAPWWESWEGWFEIYYGDQSFWKLPAVYAQDGCEWGCCQTCCSYYCCVACQCVCSGHPCPVGAINDNVSQIDDNYSEIDKSNKNLKNLIEEKEIEDKLKISKIFNNLSIVQNKLGFCYNSKEAQIKLLTGEEKVLWKELYSCSRLKQFVSWQIPFYDESGRRIEDCYGPTSETPDLLDNFLCCQAELF